MKNNKSFFNVELVNDATENKQNEILKKHPNLEDPMSGFRRFLKGKGNPGDTLETFSNLIDIDFSIKKIENNDIYIEIDKYWFDDEDRRLVEDYILTEDSEFIDMNMHDSTSKKDFLQNMYSEADTKTIQQLSQIFPNLDDLDDKEDYYEMEEAYGEEAIDELFRVYVRALDYLAESDYYDTMFKGYDSAIASIGEMVGYRYEGIVKIKFSDVQDMLLNNMEDEYTTLNIEDVTNGTLSLGINYDYWYPSWTSKEFNDQFQEQLSEESDNISMFVKAHLISISETDILEHGQGRLF
jgi:hypothetical protein